MGAVLMGSPVITQRDGWDLALIRAANFLAH